MMSLKCPPAHIALHKRRDRPAAVSQHLDLIHYCPTCAAAFFMASSTAFFMLNVSAPWLGGKSFRLFRCTSRNGPAAVGAHSFCAKNLPPTRGRRDVRFGGTISAPRPAEQSLRGHATLRQL